MKKKDLGDTIVESPDFIKLLDLAIDNPKGLANILKYLFERGAQKILNNAMYSKTGGNKEKVDAEFERLNKVMKDIFEKYKMPHIGDSIIISMFLIALAGLNKSDCEHCKKREECIKELRTPKKGKDANLRLCEREDRNLPGYA